MILRYSPTGIGPYGGDYPDERPRTRGECMTMPRPCPFVSCRYHLAIDAHRTSDGRPRLRVLRLEGPCRDDEDHDDLAAEYVATSTNTCALDVADGLYKSEDALDGEAEEVQLGYQELAKALGDVVTWQRVHQTVASVQAKMRKESAQELEDYHITPKEDEEEPEVPRWMKLRGLVMCELAKGPRSQEKLNEAMAHLGFTDEEVRLTMRTLPNVKIVSPGTLADEAANELRSLLARGPATPSAAVAHVVDQIGCSGITVQRAAKTLGVLSTAGGSNHKWKLPPTNHTGGAGVVKKYGRSMLSLVGGKANPRHPGHAGKAGRSD